MRVGRGGWSVEVSDAWSVTEHPECLTLELSGEGALQLSSARKLEGSATHEDLFSFDERRSEWGQWRAVTCGVFTGIVYEYSLGEAAWKRWFLRKGRLLVFVTYNATHEAVKREQKAIAQVLSTMQEVNTREA
jgi:hypothetical protein